MIKRPFEHDLVNPPRKPNKGSVVNLCSEIPLGDESQTCCLGEGIDTTPIKLSFWQKVKKFSNKICNIKL